MARYKFNKEGLKIWKDVEDEYMSRMVEANEMTQETWDHSYWLRVNMTGLERKVWKFLGAEENQWGFVRQWPLRGYYLDFFSHKHNVGLEADGPDHVRQLAADRQRDAHLLKSGVRVYHVTPADFVKFGNTKMLGYIQDFVFNSEPKDGPGEK